VCGSFGAIAQWWKHRDDIFLYHRAAAVVLLLKEIVDKAESPVFWFGREFLMEHNPTVMDGAQRTKDLSTEFCFRDRDRIGGKFAMEFICPSKIFDHVLTGEWFELAELVLEFHVVVLTGTEV
jgi:hypothetical protein